MSFLIRNKDQLPVKKGPNVGKVLPYFTVEVDGESLPAAFPDRHRGLWADSAEDVPATMCHAEFVDGDWVVIS